MIVKGGGNGRGEMVSRLGAVLPLVSVSMIALMSMMAFALDVGALQREKRLAQTAADAAALAGAAEIYRGNTGLVVSSAHAESARNGFTHGQSGVIVNPIPPPTSGYYVGDSNFVEVIVTRDKPMLFGFLLGRNSATVRARAVAGAEAPSSNCLVALHPSKDKALNVASGSTVNANTCGVRVNSNNGTNAMAIESGSRLIAGTLGVTGAIEVSSGSTVVVSGSQQTGVAPIADPLAQLQMPPFPATPCISGNVGGTTTMSPGNYCGGLKITGNVTMNPGLYVVRGGGIEIDGRVTGTGVTIVNTVSSSGGNAKELKISSSAQVTLSAMTTGTLAGILFYQDRAGGSGLENIIDGNTPHTFTGTLYFPTQHIKFSGSLNRITVVGGIVARSVSVESGSTLTLLPDVSSSTVFTRFSLVE